MLQQEHITEQREPHETNITHHTQHTCDYVLLDAAKLKTNTCQNIAVCVCPCLLVQAIIQVTELLLCVQPGGPEVPQHLPGLVHGGVVNRVGEVLVDLVIKPALVWVEDLGDHPVDVV